MKRGALIAGFAAPDQTDGVIGRVLLRDVKKGEPILPSYVAGDGKAH